MQRILYFAFLAFTLLATVALVVACNENRPASTYGMKTADDDNAISTVSAVGGRLKGPPLQKPHHGGMDRNTRDKKE